MPLLVAGILSALTMISSPAAPQNATAPDFNAQKHVLTTLRDVDGRLELTGSEIAKEWTTSIVHVKGNARIYISTGPKNARNVTMVSADAIDCNTATGDIFPSGHVRVSVEGDK